MVLLLFAAAVLPAAGANIAASSITVSSVPGGASATLDGVYQGLTPLGNDGLLIDPGPPQLVLSRSGYRDEQHPFGIGSGQRSEIRITLSTAPGQVGSISIVSSPAGARVAIDGPYRMRTPSRFPTCLRACTRSGSRSTGTSNASSWLISRQGRPRLSLQT